MSPQFKKTLETRIQELTTAIEAQTTELAAYEKVLQIELAKDSTPTEKTPSEVESKPAPVSLEPAAPEVAPASELAGIKFTGNKTTLVADIVKSYGKAGAVPKDVEKIFTDRKIERSKNLVYNTLSYLVGQKKLRRHNGRYFGVSTAAATPTNNGAAPTKRRISPAGIKRIKEAMKKRWAAKKAADRAAAK
jgi:hypothetical protein